MTKRASKFQCLKKRLLIRDRSGDLLPPIAKTRGFAEPTPKVGNCVFDNL
jgi:hypothetical protein